MRLHKVAAGVALTALVLGVAAGPALADRGGRGKGGVPRISESFKDMKDFDWGLSQVVRMQAKGIFKGRGPGVFAPGEKITHQEAAVAVLRLMDKETTAKAMAVGEAETLLKDMPDRNLIAPWAKSSVAMMVKLGMIPGNKSFNPTTDATRLDVAVMLVKVMGYEADAQAHMSAALPFQDAGDIPADLVGYVAVAVDRGIITGVVQGNGRFFFPNHPVKRIEMAVMMGRTDRLVDRIRQDELKGVITAVNVAGNSFTVNVRGQSRTVELADDAAIFVNDREGDLLSLQANMKVEVKLNASGKVIYVEAKTDTTEQGQVIEGNIIALTAPTTTAPAQININSFAYSVAPNAVVTLDTQASTFANLRVGDSVRATLANGLIVRLEARRNTATVTGTIQNLTAATTTSAPVVRINNVDYGLAASAAITLENAAANFANLRVGDAVTAMLANNLVVRLDAHRTVTSVTGTVIAITAATQTSPAGVTLSSTVNNQTTFTAYPLESNAVIQIDNANAALADLQIGDTTTLTLASGFAISVAVTRVQTVTVSGTIAVLTAGVSGSPGTPARIMVGVMANGTVSFSTYDVPAAAQILINGQATNFAALQVNDNARLTLTNNVLSMVEVTR